MIYFIQQGNDGAIKIGFTDNTVEKRLVQLQQSTPERLMVISTLTGGKREERAIHKRFQMCQIRGEWFAPHPLLLDFIRRNCADFNGFIKLEFDTFVYANSLREELNAIEKRYVEQAMQKNNHNMTKTAKQLKVSVPTLYHKVKKYNISNAIS